MSAPRSQEGREREGGNEREGGREREGGNERGLWTVRRGERTAGTRAASACTEEEGHLGVVGHSLRALLNLGILVEEVCRDAVEPARGEQGGEAVEVHVRDRHLVSDSELLAGLHQDLLEEVDLLGHLCLEAQQTISIAQHGRRALRTSRSLPRTAPSSSRSSRPSPGSRRSRTGSGRCPRGSDGTIRQYWASRSVNTGSWRAVPGKPPQPSCRQTAPW
eukprot:3725003-Rhodomonas_salina.1